MANGPIELHEIPYERLFPWVRLFRAFGVATDPKKLLLAVAGVVLMFLGWVGIDRLFPGSELVRPPWTPAREDASERVSGITYYPMLAVSVWHEPVAASDGSIRRQPRPSLVASMTLALWRVTEPVRALTEPFLVVFSPESTWEAFWHALLTAVWSVMVWGLIGGAIARIAVMQVARGERVGTATALRFASRKWLTLIGAPLSPLLGVAFFAGLCALFGLLYRIPVLGPTVAGVLLFLPLLAGVLVALILIGLGLGWPIMPATVAAEGEDGFDAVSRTYAYINQRRGYYLGYYLLASVIGYVGLVFVDIVARTVVQLSHWSLSFGAPRVVLSGLFGVGAPIPSTAASVHAIWLSLIDLVVHGWIYSYFWTASTIIYLLLRLSVDGTPISEVHRVEPEQDPAALPPEAVTGGEPVTPAPSVP